VGGNRKPSNPAGSTTNIQRRSRDGVLVGVFTGLARIFHQYKVGTVLKPA
jgi:hypothetical protein